MEGKSHHIYLFGDQTGDFENGLRGLLQAKNHPVVSSFFQRCYHAVRQEIAALPPSERSRFPRFTSIVDLLARHCESRGNPAIESALTCIYQLGCFINYHGDLGHAYPSSSKSHIIGLCTGLLSCAAVSSARNIGELLQPAVAVVVVALRLGLCVLRVRGLVDQDPSASGSWAALVSGINEQEGRELITKFCQQRVTPPSSQPYISAVCSNTLTISGPPKVLDELVQTTLAKESRVTRASIHGPYHAAHLYDERDVERILETCDNDAVLSLKPHIPVLSSNTGEPIVAHSMNDFLKAALEEILVRQLCWDRVTDACAAVVLKSANNRTTTKIFPVATTATQSLFTALRKSGLSNVQADGGMGGEPAPASSQGRNNNHNDTGRAELSKIAIIGMSGRFPEADSPQDFWNLLYKGLDVHRKVPAERWDADAHVDPTGTQRNTSRVPYGCWIREPGLFDPRFFNMSPREALQADPAQRLALLTAYEALEMAGFIPDSTPSTQRDRVGIFYGMTSDDYRETNSGQDIDTYFIPGGNRAFTPGRINFYFKFSGPSVSVDTACSSSLAAIHLACNSIWRNDCDAAITGGVNILTNPDNHAGLDRGHFLSRTGNCNTFDDAADGYCRADGVGTVILKRLEDAQADNDPILGIINGAYTNHSAEAVSITRPHVGAQAFIFKKLLNEANVDPKSISYVEMHGTGTQAGDAVEMQSVLDVFAPDHSRGPAQSLHLGSAKSNIGHGESASGVTSLVKVLMMMKENMIPPHCGIKTKINHNFPTDLPQRNVHIALQPTPWNRPASGKRSVFLNNFSAAGGNTALLLEDAAPLPTSAGLDDAAADPRRVHVVTVSARSQTALRNNVSALVKYIDDQAKSFGVREAHFVPSLSYTTTARRIHHPFRVTAVGSSLHEIRDALSTSSQREVAAVVPTKTPGIGFIFTGQGAQYAGMGKQLYETCATFRATIQHFDCIGRRQGFPSILPLVDGSVAVSDLSPVVVQLGTTCVQMALTSFWSSLGVVPGFVMGHSLGDFAALNAAGVLSTSDTIYVCGRRAQLLTEQCEVGTHAMLAVKASLVEINPLLTDGVHDVACINSPSETVISGPRAAIEALSEACSSAKTLRSTKLTVPYAFHSAQVGPILDGLERALQGVTFNKPRIPFVSALLGEVISEANARSVLAANYLVRHCREPVNFLSAVEATRNAKLSVDQTLWLEVGPHPICSGMVKATLGPQTTTLASLRRDEDTWAVLSASLSTLHLAGIDINWKQYHQDFSASHRVLSLPAYKWDLKNYWIPYANNFCLTKGAAPLAAAAAAPAANTVVSISAQKVIESRDDGTSATVVVENDISDPELNRVIQGHKVNGAALCPSSLYADIAQTLADYLIEQYKPEFKTAGLDVCNMTVPKPLIAKTGKERFRVSATASWAEKRATVQVWSVTAAGKKILDHASCEVRFFDCAASELEWKRSSYLIQRSIERLEEHAVSGEAHRLRRGMVYKLFAALVDYDENYRSIREVILDSEQHEATAWVKFQAPPANFHRNPFWIDCFGHLSGFIMNASDATDSKNQVFVNHGWDSMRCLKKFSPDITYRTYVRMQPWKDSIWAGDVYIFDGDDVVAVFGGVRFQALARKILDTVLPPPGASKTAAPRQAATSHKPTPSSGGMARPNAPVPSKSFIKSSGPSVVVRALKILASEVGLSESDLTDDLTFADYGVDSLLSLTITGRYREELGLDLESSVFMDQPTVRDFKHFVAQVSPSESSDGSSSSTEPESDYSFREGSSLSSTTSAGSSGTLSPPNEKIAPVAVKESSSSSSSSSSSTLKEIRTILADEIGIPETDLQGTENLAEMGMDSLLSLTVLGRIRETLGIDLPGEFFIENQTLSDIEETLGLKPKAAAAAAAMPGLPMPEAIPLLQEEDEEVSPMTTPKVQPSDISNNQHNHPPATSILLQGNPQTATTTLFLFPDGSGSATSYAAIPRVSRDICIYGLNCPYMKTPEQLTCSLDDLTTPYLAEIRRRQPRGPYNLGGWSAGGICAYDAAKTLILQHGEQVTHLLLLDSPFPIGLEKLPPRLYAFFDSVGLFGRQGQGENAAPPPAWLLPHFLAFIDALDSYAAKTTPLPFTDARWARKMPRTHLIWAKDGVCANPGDPWPQPAADGSKDPKEMVWLLRNRTDLGPNRWDTLVGPQNIGQIAVMEGANHFSMTRGEKAKELALFMERALS
ncbi:polyketide synthetase PksP [Aspergillus rambellii]|uniref:Polyketide synthetase PksP n=1 Tax=Aspergillus rambellii TaxID=308745 RepID=A0A0F8US74_9EURO|nr:polyketide synthetase PksP [Aspergillus rambellii]